MTDNLTNLISQAVAARMTPDFIEKEVNSRVEKLVIECIDKSFRSYSDTAKQVEEAVTEALKVHKLDLPSYGEMVTVMLKKQIEAVVAPIVAGRLASDMEELLGLAPKEVKLSEIAEFMRQEHEGEDRYGQVITVILEEPSYSSQWLHLDEDHHYSAHDKHKCKHRLLLNQDGTISGGWIGDRDFQKKAWFGRAYGIEQRLRSYIACGTKITIDVDAVVTSVGDW
ncbi:hypothetical protein [Sphingobium sp. CFD-2]|uniref:hypothetical protein n=1 Tax=Sphingobium sp. CFD-2 TaxID=2878542 RepID=UPI00214C79E7|nr:hypothetical protein [Sphingobium sp. CFD-2]